MPRDEIRQLLLAQEAGGPGLPFGFLAQLNG